MPNSTKINSNFLYRTMCDISTLFVTSLHAFGYKIDINFSLFSETVTVDI